MLTYLQIRDFGLIDRVELELGPGLTVLTGETGAGKSMLVDALGLVLGDRAEPRQIRHGCERAEVSAGFDLAAVAAARDWYAEQGLDADDDCLVRRVIAREGRSRAFVNGTPVTLQALKALGDLLADIHGQHEHQSLLRPEAQRRLLDAWGRHEALLQQVAAAHAAWQAAASEHAECSAGLAASSERRELLRYQLHELEALAPRPGELAELEEEHRRLAHADELLAGLQALVLRLYAADEDSVHDLLARAGRELAELQALDPALAPAARTLDESLILLREGVDTLRERADGIDLDPARLAQVEQRIAALLEAGRKYRVAPETLPELLAQVAQQLGDDDDPDARSARLAAALEQARARYAELAGELGRRRAQAASGLAEAVSAGMQQLGMPGGRLVVELLPLAGTAGSAAGDERVQYLVASNPGQPALPLAQFASGGELSRISLAIQSVTAAGLEVVTQVYDEVDVGVGGRVAEIVGRRLRELAASRQVLCITHLPQVAALAHHHLQVTKSSSGQATRTEVAALDRSARVQELARMLGGLQITAQTRAHAEEMLELAAG